MVENVINVRVKLLTSPGAKLAAFSRPVISVCSGTNCPETAAEMWKRGGRSDALDRAQALLSARRTGRGGAGSRQAPPGRRSAHPVGPSPVLRTKENRK